MSLAVEIDESNEPLTNKVQDTPQIVINKIEPAQEHSHETKIYRRRWVTVGLFILYAIPNNCQWIQYSIISNIISRYYNVSTMAVDFTSITFMAYYTPLIFPATYLIDRVGLRWTVILGSVLNCIGSWIKVFSVSRDSFWITFIGQSVVASAQVLILTVPGRLAACWFDSHEVSTATSLCLFATQLGNCIGFLASPMIVGNHEDPDLIGEDLSVLFRSFAAITTFSALMVVLFFKDEPKLPPSKVRAVQKSKSGDNTESIIRPIKRLLTNKSYLALCNSYGMGIGVLNAMATLLNQMVLVHFENGEKSAGEIGLALTAMGMVGALVFGMVIDKTHRFKETTVTVFSLMLCGQISFGIAMMLEIKWMCYATGMFLGFFLAGYLPLGYELCIEYTYPEAEDITSGLLNILNNIYGVIFVLGLGKVIETYGDLGAHIGLCCAVSAGLIMTLLTKDEQRRQKVLREIRAASLLALSENKKVLHPGTIEPSE